jgi:hypothetical protein
MRTQSNASREEFSEPIWGKNVSAHAAIGVLGLLGGVVAGVVQARMAGARDLEFLTPIVKGGVVGSFAGLGLVALAAFLIDRRSMRTTRGLMVAVAVAAFIFSFTISILVGLASRDVL